ncbi:MAG: pseudouridine synthase [Gemmatimonadota bacterium]
MSEERLNRYIVRAAGVSRRTADEMIRRGRVTVGGRPATDPGALFDPGRREVRIDGNAVVAAEDEKIYVMAYKPDNVVTTMKDKEGRRTAASLVGDLAARVFPIGRLDYHTTGLLLFTNDGELAYKLTHPRFGVEKTYVAKVMGVPTPGRLGILRRGLPIEGEMTNPAQVKLLEAREGKAWVSIRIAEGRYHQVRKMFDAIGHRVMKLRRTAVGPLELGDVEPGAWRYLTGKEVRELLSYVEEKEGEGRGRRMVTPGEMEAAQDRLARLRNRGPGRGAGGPGGAAGERKGPRQPKPSWKRRSGRQ